MNIKEIINKKIEERLVREVKIEFEMDRENRKHEGKGSSYKYIKFRHNGNVKVKFYDQNYRVIDEIKTSKEKLLK